LEKKNIQIIYFYLIVKKVLKFECIKK
jgi:hypothetical protein